MRHFTQYMLFVRSLGAWRLIPLYVGGVVGTAILVLSGLDWRYLVFISQPDLRGWLYVADGLGFLLAFFLPPLLFLIAGYTKRATFRLYTAAVTYSVILGFTISTFIKVFTGRTSPPHRHHGEMQPLIDNSQAFNFGFMREQIFGGWPSSHTTIATAVTVTLCIMLPIRWYYKLPIVLVALFIGIGVTLGYHWLSEFVAGACLGTAIGLVVGRHYQGRLLHTRKTKQA